MISNPGNETKSTAIMTIIRQVEEEQMIHQMTHVERALWTFMTVTAALEGRDDGTLRWDTRFIKH